MQPHERFRDWIKDKGWTQEEAAAELGCSQSLVSSICSGDRRPGVDLIHAIERLTKRWSGGCIRTEEWVTAPKDGDSEKGPVAA